jgi:hypothetical protein
MAGIVGAKEDARHRDVDRQPSKYGGNKRRQKQ